MEPLISQIREHLEKSGPELVAQSTAALSDVSSFISAVDWSELWIQILVASHVLLLILIIITRKDTTIQFTLLFTMVIAGGASERINSFLKENWMYFSRVNYFDEHGVFIAFMYSLPLVLLSLVVLTNILFMLFNLLITVKRQQLRSQVAESKKTQ